MRVVGGKLKGCDAHVTERADGRLDASVSMFGRPIPGVVLDASEAQPIER